MDQQVTLTVEEYLNHLGIEAPDGDYINAPYRKDADSGSFHISDEFWYDFSHQKGGNTWQLALEMFPESREEALRTFYEAAGMPTPGKKISEEELNKSKAEAALRKVRDSFGIDGNSPEKALSYLKERKITNKCWCLLAYMPEGGLTDILSEEEIDLTGLRYHEEKLILWHLRQGQPVYYSVRDLDTKEFRKASTEYLDHPIWNVDALYKEQEVVWAEGFFDVLSLIELGYNPVGEVTCSISKQHQVQLKDILRYRNRYIPDGKFTICLDNDLPDEEGRRPGNEAAEILAGELLQTGLQAKWVKHDLAGDKEDINDLHVKGREKDIHQMLNDADDIANLVSMDEKTREEVIIRSIVNGNWSQAKNIVEDYAVNQQSANSQSLDALVKKIISTRRPWKDYYDDRKIDLSVWKNYVLIRYRDRPEFNETKCLEVNKGDLCDHIRDYQRSGALDLKYNMLDIPAREPYWQVEKDVWKDDGKTVNRFIPSPLLLQTPSEETPELPEMWDKVFRNLAGDKEREWLLNHIAVYFQTLKKPRTIPVLYSPQGTCKNTLSEFLGKAVGSYSKVERQHVESQFNSYLESAIVFIDEFSVSQRDAKQSLPILKQLINESQSINEKYQNVRDAYLNNYILIASNPHATMVPVPVEEDDRRYTIINGGGNRNMERDETFRYEQLEEELPQLARYFLSREINEDYANTPLDNEIRRRIIARAKDPRQSLVEEWIAEHYLENWCDSLKKVHSSINSKNTDDKFTAHSLKKNEVEYLLEQLGYEIFWKNKQKFVKNVTTLKSPVNAGPPEPIPDETDKTDPVPEFSEEFPDFKNDEDLLIPDL